MPQDTPKPIAEWLRATRTRHRMTDKHGEQVEWTYGYLLAEMKREIDWAPASSNYSRYETGKQTPRADTLRRFVKFWAGHGEAGPDTRPEPATEPTGTTETPADLADALRAQTKAITALVGELRLARGAQRQSTDALLRAMASVVDNQEPRGRSPGSGREDPARISR